VSIQDYAPESQYYQQAEFDVEEMVTLHPLAMRIPNEHGIYQTSKIKQVETITAAELQERFGGCCKQIRVCLGDVQSEDELLAQSKMVIAYGFGLDCWYIVKRETQ